jgi:choline kinase
MNNNLVAIIPSAGMGRRMRSYGPKCLIEINGKSIIHRQIEIIKDIYPEAQIIVITGFEADKVRKELPTSVITIENREFEQTNVAHSINLGLQATDSNNILIVYGDLIFNKNTLEGFYPEVSTAIVDKNNMLNKSEVGVTIINDEISIFSYGLPIKWAQIIYLTNNELYRLRKIINNYAKRKLFGFEILNEVLRLDGKIQARAPLGMQIAEIDSSQDIDIAKRVT